MMNGDTYKIWLDTIRNNIAIKINKNIDDLCDEDYYKLYKHNYTTDDITTMVIIKNKSFEICEEEQ